VKSNRERGPWGTWLRQERLRRGLSAEQVREMLAKRGYRVSESAYAEWESGYKKQPSREAQPILVEMWGSQPDLRPAEESDDADLAAAIRAQTEAINAHRAATEQQAEALLAILEEMRETRESQKGRDEALAVALDALSEQLAALRPVLAGRSR
jgi:transcriptional regulator with XRE-family HTH domain